MFTLFQLCVTLILVLSRTAGTAASLQSGLYFFYRSPHYPRDCKEALDACHYRRTSGVYVVKPDGYNRPFEVYCDNTFDSGGWTVILRRFDGYVTFQRDWSEFKHGFGFLSQEMWIGHEKLSFLTNQKIYQLRIDITYSDGTSVYALFRLFRISDDFSNYRISTVRLYSGTLDYTRCPTNMEYGRCLCQYLCGNVQVCQPCPIKEECFCPSGFFLKGPICVSPQECGCFIDGITIQEGEVYTSPGCLRRCYCISGLLLCDENYRCSNNAVCERRNGVLQCYCNEGYMGDGTTCETICPINTEYGTCICQTLCSYPDICLPCDGEMCHCPDGFYLQGGDCVRQEDCDCYIDNNIVQEGQTYIAPGCSKRCTCIEGQLFCDENYRCDPNASCVQQNDKYHCICNQGFVSYRDTCVSICSTNEMYGTCSCEKSCGNPDLCTSCSGIQGQRCYCPNGFYLQGQDCVPREECNCFEEGAIIPEGQTYIAPGCAKRCTCINGQLSCDENYRCDANAACVHENSMYQCICNQGFVRHEETCISICSTNEIYGTCGCETSCGNPDLCTPCGSQGERCYCPNGLYLQGKDCITQEECNCFEDGIIIPEGQEYVAPGCTKRCNCINGQIQCDESYRCGPNAACVQQSNMFQCTCNDGFTLSGGTCESICSINEMYGTCSCERSCVNPEVCTPCDTQGQRCYCPNGFYIHGQDCVPQDGCGCYIDGTILQNGETYVDSECTQLCSCDTDQLTCVNYECSPNAVCREENNVRKCYCTEGYEGDGETCTRLMFTDCYDAYQAGERQDGVYSILPLGWTGSAFDVPCNMSIDGGGWTVLQRRIDGSEDFELNWNEFKNGFGVPGQEIWLGNDKMHIITNQRQYELRMDMVNLNGNAYFAKYSLFRIKDEDSNYQLELGIFDSATSTAGYDAMLFHRNKFFSTPDRDNDSHSSVHCAVLQRSSWWYNGCSQCNFNRPLIGSDTRYTSPYWFDYPTEDFLMYTDIKIRPV